MNRTLNGLHDSVLRRAAVIAYHSSPLQEPGAGDAGGMTVYVRALAERLAARGLFTDIFTRASSRGPRIVPIAPGVRVVSIEAGPPAPVDKRAQRRYLDDFVVGVRAFATTQRISYDLVHSHYWQSGLAARILAGTWQTPFVHSHHSLARVKNEFLAPGDQPEPASRIRGEEQVIGSADVLIASTDEEWEQLSCLYGAPHDRLKTLHPGVDHAVFSPGSKAAARARLGVAPEGRMLLAVGRVQPLKGLDLAVRALGDLVAAGDEDLILTIVGGASGPNGDPEGARLRSLGEALGVSSNIRWAGPQPHAGLPDFYRAADCLVVCSYTESFGLAALEAHACGIPVVATAVGGLRHIVEDGRSGFLVPQRDAQVFSDRVRAVIGDVNLQTRFGSGARLAAGRFSWDATADVFLELYECLVNGDVPEMCTC